MQDKLDELETIMLGENWSDPKFAWLKKKFDSLRSNYPTQQYVQRTAFQALLIGVSLGSVLALIFHHLLFGYR